MVMSPRDSDLRMTALARTINNCKRQIHLLVREVEILKGLVAKTN
jgi:hypothetical protein